jgi:hypothetical protein
MQRPPRTAQQCKPFPDATHYRSVQELREKQEQFQTAVDEQTRREETNNRTVQELREKQKQLQTTISEQQIKYNPM